MRHFGKPLSPHPDRLFGLHGSFASTTIRFKLSDLPTDGEIIKRFDYLQAKCKPVTWLICFSILFLVSPIASGQAHGVRAFAPSNSTAVFVGSKNTAYEIDGERVTCLAAILLAAIVFLRNQALPESNATQKSSIFEEPRFWALVVHDLRHSNQTVRLIVDVIAQSELSGHQRDAIIGASQSLATTSILINDLATLAVGESQGFVIQHRATNLQELLATIQYSFALQASDLGARFLMQRSRNLPINVVCDPIRLEQVISNLITNAIEHSEQGSVVLSVEVKGRGSRSPDDDISGTPSLLWFSVRDDGPGIADEIKERLFSPISAAVRAGDLGGGLGLYICQRLIHAMGGQIQLLSSSAKGTEIAFSLPLVQVDNH